MDPVPMEASGKTPYVIYWQVDQTQRGFFFFLIISPPTNEGILSHPSHQEGKKTKQCSSMIFCSFKELGLIGQ